METHWFSFDPPRPAGDFLSLLPVSVVECLFQGHRAKPLTGPIRRAPKGGLPGTPPVVPHPESLPAQAAYRGRHSAVALLRRSCLLSRVLCAT
jgi:hypothetical protein